MHKGKEVVESESYSSKPIGIIFVNIERVILGLLFLSKNFLWISAYLIFLEINK